MIALSVFVIPRATRARRVETCLSVVAFRTVSPHARTLADDSERTEPNANEFRATRLHCGMGNLHTTVNKRSSHRAKSRNADGARRMPVHGVPRFFVCVFRSIVCFLFTFFFFTRSGRLAISYARYYCTVSQLRRRDESDLVGFRTAGAPGGEEKAGTRTRDRKKVYSYFRRFFSVRRRSSALCLLPRIERTTKIREPEDVPTDRQVKDTAIAESAACIKLYRPRTDSVTPRRDVVRVAPVRVRRIDNIVLRS